MTLRNKTLVVISTTLILMILIIYSITGAILLGGYVKLEKQNILQNTDQAIKMIDDELTQLKSIVGDWAPWDDTYQFVQDKNQEYIDNNLMDTTLVNFHINFLMFINSDSKIIYCKYIDLETGKGAVCPDSILAYVSTSSFLFLSKTNQDTLAGLTILPENPLLLASAPILTSQFKGPAKGTLIAGRYLSAPEIKRLASKVNLSIRLQRLDSVQLPNDFKIAKQSLSIEKRVTVRELDNKTIAAYALLTNLQDNPILMLGIDKERLIFAQGKTSMNYLILSLLVTGLVFIIATLLFLEVTVLSRMVRLNNEVKKIGSTGDLSKRTTVHGKDELAGLSTEINQMLESVRVSTERDRAILESMEDAYFELDLKGKLTFFNDSLSRLFRYTKKDLKGVNYRHLLKYPSSKRTFNSLKQLYKTGKPIKAMETEFHLKNREQIFLESTITLIKDTAGKAVGFRGITRDVTERKKVSEKLAYMAYHDSLTGMLNCKAFHRNLAKELVYAARYNQQRSLLFIDLDKFKKVNDTYGHNTGDQLLKEFANRVDEVLRKTDTAYRLGGDEFAVILSDPLHNQNPEATAKRLMDAMEDPFQIESKTIDFVTMSIGISIFPLNGSDVESLLLYADKAMYKAKKERSGFST